MSFISLFIITISIYVVSISTAHAYIDMGTGSMIFQMIVAGLVGASFTIKMYWRTIVTKVRHLLGKQVADNNTEGKEHHDSPRTED